MARDLDARVRNAAAAVLTDQEQVETHGECWAVQRRSSVPLLFLGRHRYHVALTDRRVLVFARRRGGPDAADLVLGKRYHGYEVEKVRRGFPMFQVRMRAVNGSQLVFEFARNQRRVGRALVEHLEAGASIPSDTHIPPMVALLESSVAPRGAGAPAEARSDPDEVAGTPPPNEEKLSRKERKRLAREADEQLEEPPDAAAQEYDAARFWDPPNMTAGRMTRPGVTLAGRPGMSAPAR